VNRPGFPGDQNLWEDGSLGRQGKYPAEVRERAVRLVLNHQGEHESQWAAVTSIAAKAGCSRESLRKWIRQAERDSGKREGLTID
jgi:transposase